VSRVVNARRPPHAIVPPPVEDVIRHAREPAALLALLEGRSNAAREAAVAGYLEARGVAVARHRFASFEGHGENFSVDVGEGSRLLVLIAHHDAVPGSPGANDNAAAVAVLLGLLERLPRLVPPGIRVRLLFTAAEELGYLGARAYVRDVPLRDVAGVVSLELCGIGDCLAVWDVAGETALLGSLRAAFEARGLARDQGYHEVGRIPIFGSDHRAFAAAGIPAYGLSVMPSAHAGALRRFALNPARGLFMHLVRRPPPFDTYHTPRDAASTIEPGALDLIGAALEALVGAME
jgi:acetylornithine deacetylase/succinyl-diaminopimelate desuccinylase-like protein